VERNMNQKGMSLTALVALIIGATIAGAAAYMVVHHVFFSESPLSSAGDLVGTWNTNFPTKFYYATDFRTGILEDVASEDRQVTWIITEGADANTVNIEQHFTSTNLQQLVEGGAYTPDISPTDYIGIISSSSLTVRTKGSIINEPRVVGYFSFTTDSITGTWSDNWTMIYTQNVYTAVNGLKLTRQH
jgi:hypothetical protein